MEKHVLVQLESLRTHPSVAAAVGRGNLKLHGWFYKFETGEVLGFNPDTSQFEPLQDVERPDTEPDTTLSAIQRTVPNEVLSCRKLLQSPQGI